MRIPLLAGKIVVLRFFNSHFCLQFQKFTNSENKRGTEEHISGGNEKIWNLNVQNSILILSCESWALNNWICLKTLGNGNIWPQNSYTWKVHNKSSLDFHMGEQCGKYENCITSSKVTSSQTMKKRRSSNQNTKYEFAKLARFWMNNLSSQMNYSEWFFIFFGEWIDKFHGNIRYRYLILL